MKNKEIHLSETLKSVAEKTDGQKISFGDLVEALNHKGFGAMLLVPALITVLPTGAVPGVPSVTATLIILISVQILFGRHHPWLPKKLREFSFNRKKYKKSLDKILPITQTLDKFTHHRLAFLSSRMAARIIALVCILLSIVMIPLELIPFAVFLPASAILAFALGLSVKDGVFTLVGFILSLFTLVMLPGWLF